MSLLLMVAAASFLCLTGNVLGQAPDNFWKTVDLNEVDYSFLNNQQRLGLVEVTSRTESLDVNGQQVDVYFKECDRNTSTLPVLLLHGAGLSAQTWVDTIPTVQTLCLAGYWPVAVNLLGYSPTGACHGCDRGSFIDSVIKHFFGNAKYKPVVIAPSMAGSYAFPFLRQNPDGMSGFVPVAPVASRQIRSVARNIRVPTLIFYGSRDHGLGTGSAEDLKLIPTSTLPQIFQNSGHSPYLDKPAEWHNLLLNFCKLVVEDSA